MAEISTDELVAKVLNLAKPLLDKAGVDLIELKVGRHQQDVLIQITADKPTGGISIAQCSTLNKAVVVAIDEAAFMPEDCYTLEFMSPGLDRPLKTYKDFLRNMNADIHFYFHEAVSGKKEIDALLIAATEVNVTVITKKRIEIVIPLANIDRGILII